MDFGFLATATQHWTSEKWSTIDYYQKERQGDRSGLYLTTGELGATDGRQKFTLLKEQDGGLLQTNTKLNTMLKVMAASVALSYPWNVPFLGYALPGIVIPTVIIGNLVESGVAIVNQARQDKKEVELPSWDRVWVNLGPILKGGAAILAVNLHQHLYESSLLFSIFSSLAVVSWAGYVLYNPRGAALWINEAESLVGASPKADFHALAAKNYEFAPNWQDYTTGRIPLTCLLEIHSPGNIFDQVNGKPVFEEVDQKEE
ncbi:MAG: hypothetical protein JSS30_07035 [Verrucomicrobia bacterium]|nr:hypothetical protein [Verrucomicrobiota bacterium]